MVTCFAVGDRSYIGTQDISAWERILARWFLGGVPRSIAQGVGSRRVIYSAASTASMNSAATSHPIWSVIS
jgi:hypothetical protein